MLICFESELSVYTFTILSFEILIKLTRNITKEASTPWAEKTTIIDKSAFVLVSSIPTKIATQTNNDHAIKDA
jgi:hypothetical protein